MTNENNLDISEIITQLEKMDYSEILYPLHLIITYYATYATFTNYKLHKDFKQTNIKKITLPDEITPKYTEIDENKILSLVFGKNVLFFANTMANIMPKENLITLYNNINQLKVKIYDFSTHKFLFDTNTIASYRLKENTIRVQKSSGNYSIFHELLHMSSTIINKKYIYSGFHQKKHNTRGIGIGLNEGYTHLLTKRYFGDSTNNYDAYYLEVLFAEKIELLIGKETMESLYFNSSLNGLIEELQKYDTKENIAKFILGVDFISLYISKSKFIPRNTKRRMIEEKLREVNLFLLTWYCKKMRLEIQQATIIDKDAICDKLILFTESLGYAVTDGTNEYVYLNPEDITKALMNILPQEYLLNIDSSSNNDSIPLKTAKK